MSTFSTRFHVVKGQTGRRVRLRLSSISFFPQSLRLCFCALFPSASAITLFQTSGLPRTGPESLSPPSMGGDRWTSYFFLIFRVSHGEARCNTGCKDFPVRNGQVPPGDKNAFVSRSSLDEVCGAVIGPSMLPHRESADVQTSLCFCMRRSWLWSATLHGQFQIRLGISMGTNTLAKPF